MLERDPDLLATLEGCAVTPFDANVFRVTWSDKSPVQGSNGKHGRWNSPDGQFEILNTSLTAEGANAEFEAFWSQFDQRPDKKAANWKLRIRLQRVAELTVDDLERVGVVPTDYPGRDYTHTQEIADALNYLGFHGMLVPSARDSCKNLIVFIQNLDAECSIEAVESVQFSWSD